AALGTHLSGHLETFYDSILNYGEEGLAPHLRRYVERWDPDTIAVNRSPTITMADGLSATLEDYLVEAIGPDYADRLVSSEAMFIDYVSHRTPAELAVARQASEITWNILRRAFSAEVIEPGETTLMDLHWWVRQQWEEMDLEFNFPSSFDLQRRGAEPMSDEEDPVIRRGDLLHVDFGVKMMGIVTDQQKMAYVLREGETRPPEGLREAFRQSGRVVEIVAETLEPGL
ncbi:MAG: M24 family metallopeptidase, partial [Gemmatimonadota bacterium]